MSQPTNAASDAPSESSSWTNNRGMNMSGDPKFLTMFTQAFNTKYLPHGFKLTVVPNDNLTRPGKMFLVAPSKKSYDYMVLHIVRALMFNEPIPSLGSLFQARELETNDDRIKTMKQSAEAFCRRAREIERGLLSQGHSSDERARCRHSEACLNDLDNPCDC